MPKLVVRSFTLSLDGFSAAPGQSQEAPFGKDGLRLMNWVFATKHFNAMYGRPGGVEGVDNDFMAKSDENIGASIMGRHMFGPPPDAKDKAAWKGWWGENPSYHHPVFVLTHEKKAPIPMEGGTSFTFVNDGIESALKQAFAIANGKDVRLAGGADTVRQYLKAGLIDELHLVQVPLLLGQGERIFEGLGGVEDLYECVEFTPSKAVSHLRMVKKKP
ncbi:MAG TPA: dihydrofolate reductase family protein [Opitutaceae bacterium]|jgi:dihydrofolate reductase|nr:dihydrofolate reductase family protein [Opitutaceae bacterium]